jgi:phosphohistidine phosphatase
MRRLMLLRHAKSDWPDGVEDHKRPLAERGRRMSPLMGRFMVEKRLLPDLAMVSTARRAMETWELVRAAIGQDIVQKDEPRIYEAPSHAILGAVRQTPDDIHALLLVGHNPGLQDLALKLIGKGREPDLSRLQRKYPTAGLVVIDFDIKHWSEVAGGLGRLERFETPKSIGSR